MTVSDKPRKREEEEKAQIVEARAKEREQALKASDAEIQARETNREVREKVKQEVFS